MKTRDRIVLLAVTIAATMAAIWFAARPDATRTTSLQNETVTLEMADDLEAIQWASEPMIASVTNLDIDHRGRIWVCEVVNYRHNQGLRPDGDRILILEDSTGDGHADKSTVFYQGSDINAAMGICVLGNRVFVSSAPNAIVFTDVDGDDKPDTKDVLFTGISGQQHDHSLHAFVFGPDGKLYFNFGGFGRQIKSASGDTITDRAGNLVNSLGKPYRHGMVFRSNLDGSEFETIAHNFRNSYEVAVDSYGTVWLSDNDDDGNLATRVNYVMEFGNFGYTDELTGGSWKAERTGQHSEIPQRHWHQNDPGVVPTLMTTGAGAPCGIAIYEGDALPAELCNQLIHCDAGQNVVRAFPVTADGAGFTARLINLADASKRDQRFRPVDVCVAPDGSLFVADWYDPSVGGHRQEDTERGRVYRISRTNHRYKPTRFDFSTIEGAVEALKNPNQAARYLAWSAIVDWGVEAESSLVQLFQNRVDARYRARALWLLGKLEGRSEHYIKLAAVDDDPNIRVVAVRLAREAGIDVISIVKSLVNDDSAAVRRECAIALRHHESPEAPTLWAQLASQHDGNDRWYLEALGIGADQQWDAYFAAWLAAVKNNWNTPGGRDIIWRSRSRAAPMLLAEIVKDHGTTPDERLRYMRAFDFHKFADKDAALRSILGL